MHNLQFFASKKKTPRGNQLMGTITLFAAVYPVLVMTSEFKQQCLHAQWTHISES